MFFSAIPVEISADPYHGVGSFSVKLFLDIPLPSAVPFGPQNVTLVNATVASSSYIGDELNLILNAVPGSTAVTVSVIASRYISSAQGPVVIPFLSGVWTVHLVVIPQLTVLQRRALM